MSKQIVFESHARARIKEGLDALANAVKVTLGPRGRTVAYQKSWGAPGVTKDGVTVAKEIELGPKFENMGCQLVREVAAKTNDETGDGTTTATVLAQAIFTEGNKLIEAGFNSMEVKQGIDLAAAAVVAELKKLAKAVNGHQDIARIGTISANGDQTIGEMLANAMDKVTNQGVITVEEARGMETEIDIVEGMQWDRGYLSPYFVTDQQRLVAELTDPYILVHEKKISSLKELIPLLEAVNRQSASLLLIAEDVDGEALAALTLNKLRGVLKVAAVKAPGFGDRRKEMLKDIAALTGATAFMEGLGRKLESAQLEDLGRAERVVLDKDNTTIVGGQGDKAAIQARIQIIKREIGETNSDYDKEKLNERLAKLAGGVAVIKVGAATEIEMKERKQRVEDALAATRAAVEEGVVPGGGVALARAVDALAALQPKNDGQRAGINVIERACLAPLAQIVNNAGEDPATVVDKVRNGTGSFGYNAATGDFGDLVEQGVIDPVKVVRTALANAASIASLMLTTEAAVADRPKPKPAAPAGGGMGGMGMGGMGGMGMGGMGGMGMGDDFDMD